ncbi:hypothetical protein ACFVS2_20695 [Brevibacillus sp. NPDC058079]|uniref:hypothetical protein n=1 Tax=Brevibacillus sp. NPDC058079 TaxID=3346330 RepID=UPI0036E59C6F
MRKDFRDHLSQDTRKEDDQPMYQYFAKDPLHEQASQANVAQEISETVIQALNATKLEKSGYWIMLGILSVLLIPFIINVNVVGTVSCLILIGLTILVIRKVTFSYDVTTNFYLANATLTLKALFRYFSLTTKLLPYSDKILNVSVSMMMVEHFLLRWFLFAPVSSLIYTIGFYGMWTGILLCFAKRETIKAYRGLVLAYVYHLIVILLNGFYNNDLYIFTVISALILWTIACWMKRCVIEDVKTPNK